MPIIKSAKKKMRQDKRRMVQNKKYETAYKKAVEAVRKKSKTAKGSDLLRKAYKAIDLAAKKNVIHKNKAKRLKAAVAKALSHSAVKK